MSLRSILRTSHLSHVLAVLVGVVSLGVVPAQSASAASVEALQPSWGTNGRVYEVLADPASGRVYVAGDFTAVTDALGETTASIAHVAAFLPATGTFDTSWHPSPNGGVVSLALQNGTLYMGGNFTTVGGQSRARLAAVDAATGAVNDWDPGATGNVKALAAGGDYIYVGGSTTAVGGSRQPYLARVGAQAGTDTRDTGWSPTLNGRVLSIVVNGEQVYVGGEFSTVNGSGAGRSIASLTTSSPASLTPGFVSGETNESARAPATELHLADGRLLAALAGSGGACASLDATTGATLWSKHSNGNMQAITELGGTVYCGGHFGGAGSFAGLDRSKLAAVDLVSGNTDVTFRPRINSAKGVWALDSDASRLFAGGDFTKVSGKTQFRLAVFA
ncbi:MAG TPA: hypothetical protein VES21_01945 [Nocardioidaceae bacterium]|nr:hypothetical protein [Nocardioidaceae bacterium]